MQTKYKVSRVLSERISVEVYNSGSAYQLPIEMNDRWNVEIMSKQNIGRVVLSGIHLQWSSELLPKGGT